MINYRISELFIVCFRNALQDYITEDLDFQKIFTFSVNYSEIEVMITHSLPTRWRLGISSEVKGVQV